MTVDEAIRDLQDRIDGEFCIKDVDNCDDMKLGIEALKLVKVVRDSPYCPIHLDLPGETKEDDHE